MNRNLLILLFAVSALAGCVKGVNNPTKSGLSTVTTGTTTPTTGTNTGTTTVTDAIKDSVYYYSKEAYYWADALPDYTTFAPRTTATGSTDLLALTTEVNKLSQYKINPATSLPYEYVSTSVGKAKYFYIDAGQTTLRLNAINGDFGFGKAYRAATDLRVAFVNPGSPADIAGMVRGSQITAINGNTNLNFDGATGTNTTFIANAYSNSSTITVAVTKPDGTKATYSLTANIYNSNPVLKAQIITQTSGKKTGYIVFNSFITQASAKPFLDAAFAQFALQGISELVVDLRYNGGGYTETAQYLVNLIAPATTSNNTMFTATYNTTLQAAKEVLLKQQIRKDASGTSFNYGQPDYSLTAQTYKFSTIHPLNLSRVFFLVSGATASSSEITINSLRPYMNVQLVGSTTYGKPIGFIDIKIGAYTMYLPSFEIKNANGDGGYYTGMVPASSTYPGFAAADDLTHDFGDTNEGLLSAVVNFLNNGVYKSNSTSTVGVQSFGENALSVQQQSEAANALSSDQFKGMLFQFPKHK